MSAVSVIADDRTGAMETAGACADRRCPAVVVPFGVRPPNDAECTVFDLASRHLSPADARARAVAAPADALHKIDSTLRGMWAHELVARQQAHGRRLVLVPAFPAAGRTCEDGVVMVDGVPVAEGPAANDARGPVRSSRPADYLKEAGATFVDSISSPRGLMRWLQSPKGAIAVCDARTDSDISVLAHMWSMQQGLALAGTAGVIGWAAQEATRAFGPLPRRPACEPPALIVCGSLHPMALAQAAAAEAKGMTVLRPTSAERDDPVEVASELAVAAHDRIAAGQIRTVVVVGGDTTAALLGDRAVVVGGTLAPGVAWSRAWGDEGPLLATKPGGFGTASTIVDLFAGGLR